MKSPASSALCRGKESGVTLIAKFWGTENDDGPEDDFRYSAASVLPFDVEENKPDISESSS